MTDEQIMSLARQHDILVCGPRDSDVKDFARAILSASIADTDVIETPDGQNLMQVWFECGRDVFAFYDRIMGTRESIADTAKWAMKPDTI